MTSLRDAWMIWLLGSGDYLPPCCWKDVSAGLPFIVNPPVWAEHMCCWHVLAFPTGS
jgi:hypothetical protein